VSDLSSLVSLALDGIFSFSSVPIKFITLFGLSMTLIAFFYLIYVITWGLLHSKEATGWSSILASVLFFAGLQILFLGVLGQYIGRIYEEIKFRPLYFVEELTGFAIEKEAAT